MTSSDVPRTVLPIPERAHVGLTTYDAKDPDTSFPPITPRRPPSGAPNVVIVLLDDIGFGASTAFGGPCATPNADRLAARGLRFNRFHTTALCAPTRQALLTGRNHHSVGMGVITEMATSAPGYDAVRPNNASPLAETLKLNGYCTAQFGKCHEVPAWLTSPLGPFSQWPTGSGFEYFYGFLGGETNQYYPAIYEGTTPVEPSKTPDDGYHFTEDMTDKAIAWVRQQRSLMTDRPFFMYYAPGATHAPHHVPKDWADRYRGRFATGWDELRGEIFARQKELGVIPADAELTPRPDEIPAYDDMPDELRPVLERQMEVYAGFLEHTDFHVGRLLDTLDDLEVLDDTLVYYIIGDNGASAEGTINGSVNEMFLFNGAAEFETPEYLVANVDNIGTPAAYNHYAVGWAHAMCTPYQWTKQVASHWGGTRNGTIIHWPNGIDAQGEIRTQFHHVIDIATTVFDVAGLPQPDFVNGLQQMPLHGVSMAYSFDDAGAPERRETQYFEMMCNRGIYHKGWTAVTKHRTPWVMSAPLVSFDHDVWELYDTNNDWTQAHDLAAEMPDRLRDLQRLFLIEAAKYNVLPLDDRTPLELTTLERPSVEPERETYIYFPGTAEVPEAEAVNIRGRSYKILANVDVESTDAHGVLFAHGSRFGGHTLFIKDKKLWYVYNFLGIPPEQQLISSKEITKGKHTLGMEFFKESTGEHGEALGTARLYIDDDAVAEGKIRTQAGNFMLCGDGLCVGRDSSDPVSKEYPSGFEFEGGTIQGVAVTVTGDAYMDLEKQAAAAFARD
jgi:arylsulfatase A-like enzyme